MHKWILTSKQRCDLEMLSNGAFQPLTGFLSQNDYEAVLSTNRLSNGLLWPIPITLDVSEDFASKVEIGEQIELYDIDNTLLAHLTLTDKWRPDKSVEALSVFATLDQAHPGVDYLFNQSGSWYLGGSIQMLHSVVYHDFTELRHSPATLKNYFLNNNYNQIVAFQTRNPIHRAHFELTLRAAKAIDGHLLLHPVVGVTKPGDLDYFTRVRCYQKIMPYYSHQSATLSLLPLAMRMAGPKEALWHALIRKNYGCTHFIVGRDHAGPGLNSNKQAFYEPYAAQELVQNYQAEIQIQMVPFQEMVYSQDRKKYYFMDEIRDQEKTLALSGTKMRQLLSHNEPIPFWFSFPEVIQELRAAHPPKNELGLTLFFTGLSGAGKSTLAQALHTQLRCLGKRHISLIDGDIVRRILATELGFSKEDRNLNIQRIGYVASEVTKAGGIAICAAIAPYREARENNRCLISSYGNYVEIYVATPLSTCEQRDPKGLYAKVKKGQITAFTGVSDPYEPPYNPEITIDTCLPIDECVDQIVNYLVKEDYLKIDGVSKSEKEVINYFEMSDVE